MAVASYRELADFISFGLYETILEHNDNRVVVISSMGKQSTGKSYMLNHLSGSCFDDTSGGRCTDGVWMTVEGTAWKELLIDHPTIRGKDTPPR